MGTVDSEYERLAFLRGQGRGQEKCVTILPAEEAKKRIENAGEKPKTRLVKELHTPQAYSDFNREFSRYIEAAGDPNVAFSIMIRCLAQLPDSSIKILAQDDESEETKAEADFIMNRDRPNEA